MILREADFRIDFLEGHAFPGFTLGETWNGFAKPYFTFTQAQALATAWSSTGTKAFYDDQQDAFVFEMWLSSVLNTFQYQRNSYS